MAEKITKAQLKKLEKRELKKKDAEWTAGVKERDNHTCFLCGSTTAVLNSHHILCRYKHKDYRHCVDNGITLCGGKCHKFGRFSVHVAPIGVYDKLRRERPEQYALAVERFTQGLNSQSVE